MTDYLKRLDPIYQVEELLKHRDVLYRFDNSASRYYFKFVENGEEIKYMGATTATDILVKKGGGLFNWYAKNGEMAFLQLRMMAEYGTMMHTEIGLYERNQRKVTWSDVERFAYETATGRGFAFCAEDWVYHLPKNLASWIQFCNEKEVTVLAVEFPVWSDVYGIATLVDVYCEMKFNKGRVRAIINLKSNLIGEEDEDKNFYESQDCQLQIEKTLWRESVPDFPVDMVFNWAPNNWRDEPTYTLKNWTEKTRWPEIRLKESLQILKYEFNPPKRQIVLMGEYQHGQDLRECLHAVRLNGSREVIVANRIVEEDALTEQLEASVESRKKGISGTNQG